MFPLIFRMVAHNFGALAVTSSLLSSSVSHLCSTLHGARNNPPKVAVVGIFTERDYIQKLALSDWKTIKVTPLQLLIWKWYKLKCSSSNLPFSLHVGIYRGRGCLYSQETRIFRSDISSTFRTDWEMLSKVARTQRSASLGRQGKQHLLDYIAVDFNF